MGILSIHGSSSTIDCQRKSPISFTGKVSVSLAVLQAEVSWLCSCSALSLPQPTADFTAHIIDAQWVSVHPFHNPSYSHVYVSLPEVSCLWFHFKQFTGVPVHIQATSILPFEEIVRGLLKSVFNHWLWQPLLLVKLAS
jgi:hypothetical protein